MLALKEWIHRGWKHQGKKEAATGGKMTPILQAVHVIHDDLTAEDDFSIQIHADVGTPDSTKGLEWFQYFADVRNAYSKILVERNHWTKYYLAKHFAQYLGDKENMNLFDKLFEESPNKYLAEGEIPLPSIIIDDFWDKTIQ